MVVIRPYISAKSALEAIDLYKTIFNAELIERLPVEKEQAGQMGIPDGADLSKSTLHSSLKIGEAIFYMADNFTGDVLEKTNTSLLIEPDSVNQAEEFFKNAVENNCKITMKFEKQFWGDYFGSFIDPFGISWQVNFSPPK